MKTKTFKLNYPTMTAYPDESGWSDEAINSYFDSFQSQYNQLKEMTINQSLKYYSPYIELSNDEDNDGNKHWQLWSWWKLPKYDPFVRDPLDTGIIEYPNARETDEIVIELDNNVPFIVALKQAMKDAQQQFFNNRMQEIYDDSEFYIF